MGTGMGNGKWEWEWKMRKGLEVCMKAMKLESLDIGCWRTN